jgi:hypothetical protein
MAVPPGIGDGRGRFALSRAPLQRRTLRAAPHVHTALSKPTLFIVPRVLPSHGSAVTPSLPPRRLRKAGLGSTTEKKTPTPSKTPARARAVLRAPRHEETNNSNTRRPRAPARLRQRRLSAVGGPPDRRTKSKGFKRREHLRPPLSPSLRHLAHARTRTHTHTHTHTHTESPQRGADGPFGRGARPRGTASLGPADPAGGRKRRGRRWRRRRPLGRRRRRRSRRVVGAHSCATRGSSHRHHLSRLEQRQGRPGRTPS